MDNKCLGALGEEIAATYLHRNGYSVLVRNFKVKIGEIDLITKDKDVYVFVEVKTRRSLKFGDAAEAVNYYKQRKIIKVAQWYLQQKNMLDQPCRFDVVEVYYENTENYRVHQIKNAFEVC